MIRSIDQKVAGSRSNITVSKYAPAILTDTALNALVFHEDGRQVNKSHPAKRDEPLVMYAIGLGPTKGGTVIAGKPSPANPLAITARKQKSSSAIRPLRKQELSSIGAGWFPARSACTN